MSEAGAERRLSSRQLAAKTTLPGTRVANTHLDAVLLPSMPLLLALPPMTNAPTELHAFSCLPLFLFTVVSNNAIIHLHLKPAQAV
jgi:hypothetical protein